MVAVRFQSEKGDHLQLLPKKICLRDLQQHLCAFYKERFPTMMAKVTVEFA